VPGMNSAPTLRELQEWMRWAVTDPRGVEAALLEPRPQGLGRRYQAPRCDTRDAIKARDRVERETRLAIYAEAYFHRLLAALEEDFPATVRFLGQDDFARLINDYLKEFPSRSFTLADAGRNLARFAVGARADEPWLEKLIELEWRMLEAFYAPRLAPLAPAQLAGLSVDADWANAQMRFVPGLFVHESDWPVTELRLKVLDRENFEKAQIKPRWTLIHRDTQGAVELEDLSQGEATCLRALLNHRPLEAALAGASEACGDGLRETSIGAWFARWTHLGLIQQIDFPDSRQGARDV